MGLSALFNVAEDWHHWHMAHPAHEPGSRQTASGSGVDTLAVPEAWRHVPACQQRPERSSMPEVQADPSERLAALPPLWIGASETWGSSDDYFVDWQLLEGQLNDPDPA